MAGKRTRAGGIAAVAATALIICGLGSTQASAGEISPDDTLLTPQVQQTAPPPEVLPGSEVGPDDELEPTADPTSEPTHDESQQEAASLEVPDPETEEQETSGEDISGPLDEDSDSSAEDSEPSAEDTSVPSPQESDAEWVPASTLSLFPVYESDLGCIAPGEQPALISSSFNQAEGESIGSILINGERLPGDAEYRVTGGVYTYSYTVTNIESGEAYGPVTGSFEVLECPPEPVTYTVPRPQVIDLCGVSDDGIIFPELDGALAWYTIGGEKVTLSGFVSVNVSEIRVGVQFADGVEPEHGSFIGDTVVFTNEECEVTPPVETPVVPPVETVEPPVETEPPVKEEVEEEALVTPAPAPSANVPAHPVLAETGGDSGAAFVAFGSGLLLLALGVVFSLRGRRTA